MTLASFLAGILGPIIRPIIQEEIAKLKELITDQFGRLSTYEKYDIEAQQLIEQIAKANTPEERWAYVATLKEKRAKLNS